MYVLFKWVILFSIHHLTKGTVHFIVTNTLSLLMADTTKNTAKTSSNDAGDPMENLFYIHHSNSPMTVLVSPPLTGGNCSTWVLTMLMALRAKNKLSFVTGDITKPSYPSQIPQWERCNDLVTSWILCSLNPYLASSILCGKTIKDVWDDLSNCFH